MAYLNRVREELAKAGMIGLNPNHVLGWMYVENNALNHMDARRFSSEVRECAKCVMASDESTNNAIAQMAGL